VGVHRPFSYQFFLFHVHSLPAQQPTLDAHTPIEYRPAAAREPHHNTRGPMLVGHRHLLLRALLVPPLSRCLFFYPHDIPAWSYTVGSALPPGTRATHRAYGLQAQWKAGKGPDCTRCYHFQNVVDQRLQLVMLTVSSLTQMPTLSSMVQFI
jgi:hypothetical protein